MDTRTARLASRAQHAKRLIVAYNMVSQEFEHLEHVWSFNKGLDDSRSCKCLAGVGATFVALGKEYQDFQSDLIDGFNPSAPKDGDTTEEQMPTSSTADGAKEFQRVGKELLLLSEHAGHMQQVGGGLAGQLAVQRLIKRIHHYWPILLAMLERVFYSVVGDPVDPAE